MNFIYMDFEFSKSTKRYVELVCASVVWPDGRLESYDLTRMYRVAELRQLLDLKVTPDTVLVAYGVDTEVRALMSLYRTSFLTEIPFKKFICLYREHKMLANRCFRTTWDEVIDKSGCRRKRPFKSDNAEEDTKSKDYINLLNAQFKFLNIHDEEHVLLKDKCRDICIQGNPTEIQLNMEMIIKYCEMDTRNLPRLHKAMQQELARRLERRKRGYTRDTFNKQLFRGWYGALIAQKVTHGYNVNLTGLINLDNNKGQLIKKFCEGFNKKFPQYKVFVWDAKLLRFVFKADAVRHYIKTMAPLSIRGIFPKSAKTRQLSISQDVFEKIYGGVKDDLPENDFLAQVYKYLRMSSALRGMEMKPRPFGAKRSKTFGEYVDLEERVVRPFYNDYGSQTSRSQPRANGYLLAKPAWLRSLIEPPPGHWIVGADYNKQEPLSTAVRSGDKALLEAYTSGDLYSEFGKMAGVLKEGMDKETWDLYRRACKDAVLGMGYGMGPKSLALRLERVLGRPVSEHEANNYIRQYKKIFHVATKWLDSQVLAYSKNKGLELADGWWMWNSNTNRRSIRNFPVQGGCAVAMRYFEYFAWKRGLHVTFTLHDGFYFYVPCVQGGLPDYDIVRSFLDCMHKGFIMAHDNLPGAELVDVELGMYAPHALKLDKKFLLTELEVGVKKYEVKEYAPIYVDPRAKKDLATYGPMVWPEFNL